MDPCRFFESSRRHDAERATATFVPDHLAGGLHFRPPAAFVSAGPPAVALADDHSQYQVARASTSNDICPEVRDAITFTKSMRINENEATTALGFVKKGCKCPMLRRLEPRILLILGHFSPKHLQNLNGGLNSLKNRVRARRSTRKRRRRRHRRRVWGLCQE